MSSSRNDSGRDPKKPNNRKEESIRLDSVCLRDRSRASPNGKSGTDTKRRDVLESKFFKDGRRSIPNGKSAFPNKGGVVLESVYFRDPNGLGKKIKEEEETFSDDPDFTNFPTQYCVPAKNPSVKKVVSDLPIAASPRTQAPKLQREASSPESESSPPENSRASNTSADDRRIRRDVETRRRELRVERERVREAEETEEWKRACRESPKKSSSGDSSTSDNRIRREIEKIKRELLVERRERDDLKVTEEWAKPDGESSTSQESQSSGSSTSDRRIRRQIEKRKEQRWNEITRRDETEDREEWVKNRDETSSPEKQRSSSQSSSDSSTSYRKGREGLMEKRQLRIDRLTEKEVWEQDEWAVKRLKASGMCPQKWKWRRHTEPKCGEQEELAGYRCYGGISTHFVTHKMIAKGRGEVLSLTSEAKRWARDRGGTADWNSLRGFRGLRWADRGERGRSCVQKMRGGRENHRKERRGPRGYKNPPGWPGDFPSLDSAGSSDCSGCSGC
ncbi:uncharacterized protein RSE6_14186 [Rhynchosporium secalis]|uniref:Uncharacterized protein n=1 Tax=Rhynchosporium secalis TaxID=38038 RepID=A0A1E1MUP6_RHYSE|nr:uncharacterized protein RSE6_14186 [Rhynchosporium secalis]